MEGMEVGPPRTTAPAIHRAIARRAVRAGVHLAARTAAIRILAIVGTLVLAWILTPAEYGTFGILAALVMLLSTFGDVGLGASLIQQEAEPSRRELSTVWAAQIFIATIGTLAIVLAAPFVIERFSGLGEAATTQLRVLAIGLPLAALRSLPTVMLERDLRYGPIAAGEIAGQLAFYTVTIPAAVAGHGTWSLVYGAIAQALTATLIVNLAWRLRPHPAIDPGTLRRLVRFGGPYQAAYALTWARDGMIPPLVGLAAGTTAAGIMTLAIRMASITSALEDIVSRVALPALSRIQKDHRAVTAGVNEAAGLSTLVLAPCQLWIVVVAPVLVPLVLSENWAGAVAPLQLVAVALLVRTPARYIRQAAFATGSTRRGILLSFVSGMVPVGAAAVLAPSTGASGAALGMLLGGATAVAVALVATPFGDGIDLARLARVVASAAIAAGIAAVPVALLPSLPAVIVSAATMGLAYGLVIWRLEGPPLRRAWRAFASSSG